MKTPFAKYFAKPTTIKPFGIDRVVAVLNEFEDKKLELEEAIEEINDDVEHDERTIEIIEAGIDTKRAVRDKAENAVAFLSKITGS